MPLEFVAMIPRFNPESRADFANALIHECERLITSQLDREMELTLMKKAQQIMQICRGAGIEVQTSDNRLRRLLANVAP
jgi:hypothetical protein